MKLTCLTLAACVALAVGAMAPAPGPVGAEALVRPPSLGALACRRGAGGLRCLQEVALEAEYERKRPACSNSF